MGSNWLSLIKKATKTSIIDNNLKKVHYVFENGKELVEEYDLDTNVLTRRAWKINTELDRDGEWEIEIGDPQPEHFKATNQFIKEDVSQPIISARITRHNLEWRIRNLPYPLETYNVSAEPEKQCITVRTTNKKYFKRIKIPDLEKVSLVPDQDNISFTHKYNTLIITYKKPKELIALEIAVFEEVEKVESKNSVVDMNNCRPS